MMDDRVQLSIEAGVAEVRLMRADKMNALDPAMFEALRTVGKRLITERGLRAVVLSGEGRAFCAGLDFGRFESMAESPQDGGQGLSHEMRLGSRSHGLSNDPQYAVMVWQDVPVPVIAAVHGVAFGGGFQLVLGADLRFVAPDARMSVMEIKWGLVPDMGGALLMRGLVRADLIRELTWSGRVFDGREAERLGLATRVCEDPRAEALAFAREVASRSPDAIRGAKRLLRLAESGSPAEVLQAESDEQIRVLGQPNQIEAVMANLQKRPPVFADPQD